MDVNQLILYRNLLKDSIVQKVTALLHTTNHGEIELSELHACFYELCSLLVDRAEKNSLEGNIWREYLVTLIVQDENAFSKAAEIKGTNISRSLYHAAANDLNILQNFSRLDFSTLAPPVSARDTSFIENYQPSGIHISTPNSYYLEQLQNISAAFSGNSPGEKLAGKLAHFYHRVGCGKTGYYKAFRWNEKSGLCGIDYPDPVTLEELIGYKKQKEFVIQNTEAFLQNKPANNLLLYGERGTGKSSTVKALVNKYYSRGLRLVEMPKYQLPLLPGILHSIRGRAQKFIIFIDDLSFEHSETEYKHMKALMEGGVEMPPENVLLYATSNRRHLVQETWNDREQAGEKHIMDAIQEKLSLSDRFGVTVTYLAPGQEEYLHIIENLARQQGIDMPGDKLRELALQWEKWYNARSGRTARQFINYLLGARKVEY